MIFRSVLLILFLITPSELTPLWEFEGEFSGLTADKLGNCYVWNQEELIKIDPTGKETFRYSELSYGDIGSVDATNTFKVMVYYREHGVIRYLDNSLSDRGNSIFDLNNEGFALPSLVCASFDNGLWIWDQALLSLTRFDQLRNRTVQVEGIDQLTDRSLEPTKMFERGNSLYLVDEDAVIEFDLFGAYIRQIPVPMSADVQLEGDLLFYLTGDTLHSANLSKYTEGTMVLPKKNVRGINVTNNRLFLISKSGVAAYSTTD